ncbi:MAG: GIY-YIG nuclease family protein [Hyphomicrobiales bacterium]
MAYSVYIVSSGRNGTLYVGMTNELARRMHEHREGLVAGFTKRYGVSRLVWYEAHEDVREAIRREKALKSWMRQWKIDLIEKMNPDWEDLYETLNR